MDVQERELICNFKKCRKNIKTYAYVTACSHVFCDEDGTREFKQSTICPACQMDLSSKFDIVRNNLQPSEQYKSMILAGLKPEIVIEICSRAISFWLYQCQQEKRYHEYTANKAKDGIQQLEQYYEQMLARANSELQSTKVKLADTKKEYEETRKRYSEISERLVERNGQHQKLQALYDGLRRKFITISNFEEKTHPGKDDSSGTPANFQHSAPRRSLQFTPMMVHSNALENHGQTKFDIGLGTPRK